MEPIFQQCKEYLHKETSRFAIAQQQSITTSWRSLSVGMRTVAGSALGQSGSRTRTFLCMNSISWCTLQRVSNGKEKQKRAGLFGIVCRIRTGTSGGF